MAPVAEVSWQHNVLALGFFALIILSAIVVGRAYVGQWPFEDRSERNNADDSSPSDEDGMRSGTEDQEDAELLADAYVPLIRRARRATLRWVMLGLVVAALLAVTAQSRVLALLVMIPFVLALGAGFFWWANSAGRRDLLKRKHRSDDLRMVEAEERLFRHVGNDPAADAAARRAARRSSGSA